MKNFLNIIKKYINVTILILCIVIITINILLYGRSNRVMIYDSRKADTEITSNNNKIFKLLLNNDSVLSSDLNKLKIKYDSLIKIQKK